MIKEQETEKKNTKKQEKTEKKVEKNNQKFAVIETGGKQYKVFEEQIIKVEKLENKEFKKGDKIILEKVLLISENNNINIGNPYIDKTKIQAEFIERGKNKKIQIVKFKSKSNYLKKQGHRQIFDKIKIIKI
jgi:large subunit ribosomal protein L21